jgi:hypothetical protein
MFIYTKFGIIRALKTLVGAEKEFYINANEGFTN